MSCPWAKIEKPEPVNLDDIMKEQLAKDVQDKKHSEEKKYLGKVELEESKGTEAEKVQFDKKYDDGNYSRPLLLNNKPEV